jgi:type I restriction enzyme, S subunit
MVHDHWQVTQLGDLISIKHGWPFKSEYMTKSFAEGPVVVGIGNFEYSGGFRFENTTLKKYTGEYPKEFVLKPGDILLVMTCQTAGGEILGIPGRIPNDDRTYLHNQRMGKVVVKQKKKVDVGFLYWLFLTAGFNQHLVTTATGTKILHTAPERIESFSFSLPPLLIQRKIASILSAYDELIENNMRRIAILEEMARMLYHEWFVNFRFPGYEQVTMVESELGMIPEGWEVRAIGDVAGANLLSIQNNNEPEEIYYVDIASVQPGQITNAELMPFQQAPNRARRVVRHGDIIWSMVRPNRKSYSIIISPPENLIVSTGFAVISAQSIPYTYLYLAISTDDFVTYLANHASGSAYPAVSAKDFLVARLLIPSEDLLNKFHSVIESKLLQKQILLRKNANLRRTRDLLLPKLISGEIDVAGWVEGDGEIEEMGEMEEAVAVGATMMAKEVGPVAPVDARSLEQRSLWG